MVIMSKSPINKIPGLIMALYALVDELESLFPGRKFTPDGHLVGSIGEVLVASAYGLELFSGSFECHDAKSIDGKLVQIKATQVKSIGISSQPEHLIVIQIQPDGSFHEVYNGPGNLPWDAAGKLQKNGQRRISITRLSNMMADLDEAHKIPKLAS
jgi:hypothetical protein